MRRLVARYLKSCLRLLPVAVILAFLVSIIGPGVALANPGWYNSSWLYRQKITINAANVTATQADFPVMISISADGGLGSHAQLDGDDILFTSDNETTKIPHEIEKYSSNGVTANLTAWVKIPTLSSVTNTEIYMYYGNAGAASQQNAAGVWDSSFRMVQHMEETTGGAGAIKDSTANSNNGTDSGSPALGVTGKVDGAITFDGVNDNIQVPDSNSLDVTGNITVQAWVNTSNNTLALQTILEKRPLADTYNYYLRLDAGYLRFAFNYNNASTGRVLVTDNTHQLPNNTWTLVAATYDQSTVRLYVNGSQVFTQADNHTLLANTGDLYIGKEFYDNLRFFSGGIDEVRVSGTARSADWLKTSYNNQSNPSAFFSVGAEQNQSVAPSVTTNAASAVEETTATLNGTLSSDGGEPCQYSFEWGIAPGVYSDNISWTENVTTGQTFNTNLINLIKGGKYYYRAKVKNSAGVTYGAELDFLTKPDAPSGFTAVTANSTQIDLSWIPGDGAGRTMVRGKLGSSPTSYTDGYPVYFGGGTAASDTGLSGNTTYFYAAWSEKTGSQQWSDAYATDSATTAPSSPSAPTVIGGKVFTVNKVALFAPWLFAALGCSLLTASFIIGIRQKTPPSGKNR